VTGQTILLASDHQRAMAHRLIDKAPDRAVLNIRPETRNADQNALLWSLLSEVARAKPGGRELTTDAWKALFMSEAGFTFQWEPGLEGRGVVPVGFKSSRLTKAEFSELIECILAFGARNGIQFSDPRTAEVRAA